MAITLLLSVAQGEHRARSRRADGTLNKSTHNLLHVCKQSLVMHSSRKRHSRGPVSHVSSLEGVSHVSSVAGVGEGPLMSRHPQLSLRQPPSDTVHKLQSKSRVALVTISRACSLSQ